MQEDQFQFTHPGRGATQSYTSGHPYLQVSIHAPREGCDDDPEEDDKLYLVSIHAPREGCDTGVVPSELYGTEFQFTHPGRGATL